MSRDYTAKFFLVLCLFTLSFMSASSDTNANPLGGQCTITFGSEANPDKTRKPAVPHVMHVGDAIMYVYDNHLGEFPYNCPGTTPTIGLDCQQSGSITGPSVVAHTGGGSAMNMGNPFSTKTLNLTCVPQAVAGVAAVAAAPKPITNAAPAQPVLGVGGKPTITAISPNSSKVASGATVTITGTNFVTGATVHFGSTAATNITVNSSTKITVASPAGSGTVDVTVTTSGGTSATSASDHFTYVIPAPAVTTISPHSGVAAGGATVTITGANFTGATAVNFGNTPATSFTVNSATKITATSPAGSSVADVTVTTSGGTSAKSASDHFTYPLVPTITAISPNSSSAAGGVSVTITGTNFNFTGATAVHFGSTRAIHFSVSSPTKIVAIAPAGVSTVDVTVTTSTGTSAISAADHFTYPTPPPAVTALSPSVGRLTGGQTVTITGTNLTAATAVSFGGTAASSFTIVSPTKITATTPAGSGAVDVKVTTHGGTSAIGTSDKFTYAPAPAVTALSLSTGSVTGGTAVTITGTNFTGATAVSFGSKAARSFTVVSPTTINAVSPSGTEGASVDVAVITPAGTSATGSADTFTYVPVPIIEAISPLSGRVAGNETIDIVGNNFTNVTAVSFGNTPAISFTVRSPTFITATSPTGTGTVDVKVTSNTGTSAAGASDRFAYVP